MPEKCADTCPQLEKLESDVRELRNRNDDAHKEFYSRLTELERRNDVQDALYKGTVERLDEISEKIDSLCASLGARISAIEAKPGKRWEGIVDKAIWAVLGSIGTFIMGKVLGVV